MTSQRSKLGVGVCGRHTTLSGLGAAENDSSIALLAPGRRLTRRQRDGAADLPLTHAHRRRPTRARRIRRRRGEAAQLHRGGVEGERLRRAGV
jgi:hypothetical protein